MCCEGALGKLKKYPLSCKTAIVIKWNNGSDFIFSVIIDFMLSEITILGNRHLGSCH